jgi:hypothetical protein
MMTSAILTATANLIVSSSGLTLDLMGQKSQSQRRRSTWYRASTVINQGFPTSAGNVQQATALLSGAGSLVANSSSQRMAASAVLSATASLLAIPSGTTAWQAAAVLTASGDLAADTDILQFTVRQILSTKSWRSWWRYQDEGIATPAILGVPATVFQATAVLTGTSSLIGLGGGTHWQATAVLAGFAGIDADPDIVTFLARSPVVGATRRWPRWYRQIQQSQRLTGTPLITGVAILAGSSSVRATPTQNFQSTAILAATSSLTGTALQRWQSTAALSASSSLIASAVLRLSASAVLASNGDLVAHTTQRWQSTAVLSTFSSLTATASLLLRASAILSASSDLIASPTNTQKWQASSILAATSTLISDTFIGGSVTGKADLAGQASLIASATAQLMRTTATLTGSGDMVAQAASLMQASSVLSAASSLIAEGLRYSPTSASLSATSAMLAGSSFTRIAGVSALAASSVVIANVSFVNLAGYAALHASSSLIADAGQISSISGIVLAGSSAFIANGFVHGPAPTVASRDHSLLLSMKKNMVGPPLIRLGH